MATVVISGYFDPIHVGHLELIKKARLKGCKKLIVIVNNDLQADLKKAGSVMNENERCEILENIKGVDEVILSIDKDRSVCKTLANIKPRPDIFANGGDQFNQTVLESQICRELNIVMVDRLGKKIQSSSNFYQ